MSCTDKLTIYFYHQFLSTATLPCLRNNDQFHGILQTWAVAIPVPASVTSCKFNSRVALTVCKHYILQISAGSLLAVTILRNLVAGKWVLPSDTTFGQQHVHISRARGSLMMRASVGRLITRCEASLGWKHDLPSTSRNVKTADAKQRIVHFRFRKRK
jgi:hypothetical protein